MANNTSLILVGLVSAILLSGMAVGIAIAANNSDNNAPSYEIGHNVAVKDAMPATEEVAAAEAMPATEEVAAEINGYDENGNPIYASENGSIDMPVDEVAEYDEAVECVEAAAPAEEPAEFAF